MNRSTSHLFWILPLGVVVCLLAMIYVPDSLFAPLGRLFLAGGPITLFQKCVYVTIRFLLPVLVIALPVAIAAIRLARRGGGTVFISSRTHQPDAATRISDTCLLAGMGVPLLAVIATGPSNHGMLLRLDQLPPSAVQVHVAVAVGACVFAMISLIVAARGRSLAGTILMVATLSVYGVVLNGPGNPIERLAPSRSATPEPPRTLIINVSDCNVPGADLWVNGVYLGKLPCRIPLDEFIAKVPVWTEAGPGYPLNSGRRIGKYRRPREAPESQTDEWISMSVPVVASGPSGASASWGHDKYYARIRYADEWAVSRGSSGGHSSGGAYYSSFEVRFERREQRLARLFDRIRVQDYRVTPEWCQTLETYNQDSWLNLHKESLTDPAMLNVLDDWARWHYGLIDIHDPDAAWRVFQMICDEADRRRMYVTADTAGRAVELLVPMLPAAQLITQAEELLVSHDSMAVIEGELFGQSVFGWVEEAATFNWPFRGSFQLGGTHGRGGILPIRGLVVAHAVWRLDQLLDSRQGIHPNIVEARLVPAMIRKTRYWDLLTRPATELGGPDIETFLLRQNWRAPVGIGTGSTWEDLMMIHGREVNRWLCLLAHLRGPKGDTFRAANASEVIALAEVLVSSEDDLKPPAFLFYDLPNGPRSLAAQFWPRYRSIAVGNPSARAEDALAGQFDYLVRMDPVSTPEMYVECWRGFRGELYETDKAISELKLLPANRRRGVLDVLTEEVRKDVSNFSRSHDSYTGPQRRARLLEKLQIRDEPRADDKTIQEMIADLGGKDSDKKRQEMYKWLESVCPSHSVVPALARSSDPALRIVCVGALRSHPTPTNRSLLSRLLTDPDEGVRKAAEGVRANLEKLAAMPLDQLRSDSPTSLPAE